METFPTGILRYSDQYVLSGSLDATLEQNVIKKYFFTSATLKFWDIQTIQKRKSWDMAEIKFY